jgi:hypothetical protein
MGCLRVQMLSRLGAGYAGALGVEKLRDPSWSHSVLRLRGYTVLLFALPLQSTRVIVRRYAACISIICASYCHVQTRTKVFHEERVLTGQLYRIRRRPGSRTSQIPLPTERSGLYFPPQPWLAVRSKRACYTLHRKGKLLVGPEGITMWLSYSRVFAGSRQRQRLRRCIIGSVFQNIVCVRVEPGPEIPKFGSRLRSRPTGTRQGRVSPSIPWFIVSQQ